MLPIHRLISQKNHLNIYVPVTLSRAQALGRGEAVSMTFSFIDDYFSNAAHKGSMWIYSASDGSKNYHNVPAGKLTVARASAAYFVNSTGYMQLANTNFPRYDHNPTTLEYRGNYIEGAGTNLLTNSANLVGWSSFRTAVTANSVLGPDNTVSLSKLVADANNSVHTWSKVSAANVSTAYCASLFVKAAEQDCITLAMYEGNTFTRTIYAIFNLANNNIVTTNTAGTTYYTSGIENWNNGVKRIHISGILGGTDTAVQVRLALMSNSTTSSFTGNGVAGIYAGFSQLELGINPSSFIPTGATSNTRSADGLTIPTANINFDSANGTLYIKAMIKDRYANQDFGTPLISAHANSTNYMQVRHVVNVPNNAPYIDVLISNGSIQLDSSNHPSGEQVSNKVAVSYYGNNVNFAVNGTTGTGTTTLNVPIINTIGFGVGTSGFAASIGFMWVQEAAYYTRAFTNAEIVTLTS